MTGVSLVAALHNLEVPVLVASPAVLSRVDHLVYATADLDRGIAEIEQLLGVRATLGGQHPAWGTRNALVGLGRMCYLEIISADPDHLPSSGGRPFGLDVRRPSRLVAWAAKGSGLGKLRDEAAQHGIELGNVLAGSRQRPDGALLTWQLTDLRCAVADGIVPFFVDWGQSPHPALAASQGATLVGLLAEHPDADRVRRILRGIAIDLPVEAGPAPALIAQIDCPKGRVVLR
jgi:Glyoxalase-like domain